MKLIKTLILSAALVILPAIGNLNALTDLRLWVVLMIFIVASLLQPDYNLKEKKENTNDHGTEVQIIRTVIFTQLCAVIEFCYFKQIELLKWGVGDFLILFSIIFGLMIRTWAIRTLGKFFTMHITIQNEQKIVKTGPYKRVRHPSYVGAFFLYFGTIVFLHSWFSLMLTSVLLPIAWLRRMHYEEKMLLEAFGDDYKNYCKKTKRFIPWIW